MLWSQFVRVGLRILCTEFPRVSGTCALQTPRWSCKAWFSCNMLPVGWFGWTLWGLCSVLVAGRSQNTGTCIDITYYTRRQVAALSSFFLSRSIYSKIQGDGRKFLDRFKSYFGSQISQSLNEVPLYRLQPKSATKGHFFPIYFCVWLFRVGVTDCKWRTKPTKCC